MVRRLASGKLRAVLKPRAIVRAREGHFENRLLNTKREPSRTIVKKQESLRNNQEYENTSIHKKEA